MEAKETTVILREDIDMFAFSELMGIEKALHTKRQHRAAQEVKHL